jgi:hypothetical protein
MQHLSMPHASTSSNISELLCLTGPGIQPARVVITSDLFAHALDDCHVLDKHRALRSAESASLKALILAC